MLVLVGWDHIRPGNTTSDDANLVFCLAPAHLDGLASAAVSLGLAQPGSSAATITVDKRVTKLVQWHADDSADFDRACDAFAGANMPASSGSGTPGIGLQTVLGTLLPALAGALLALIGTDIKDASDRRWENAAELRTNWSGFKLAAEFFVAKATRATGGLPSADDLDLKRFTLRATLLKVRAQHRRSSIFRRRRELTDVETLLQRLTADLGASMASRWGADAVADRISRGTEIADSLSDSEPLIDKVADALERNK
jgi:hypothetical protein